MDVSIWVKFISKNRNTLEIEHILLNSLLLSFPAMDFISGQLISLTNPIHNLWDSVSLSKQTANTPLLKSPFKDLVVSTRSLYRPQNNDNSN